uniref:Ion transport domain-containing protein n=1 Tax=Haptolina ericina TaxID=156174 RepID=A0A7S3BQR6_9EUKA
MPTRYHRLSGDHSTSATHHLTKSATSADLTGELTHIRGRRGAVGSDYRTRHHSDHEWDDFENIADEPNEAEGGLADLISDTFSGRIIYFFFIPRVKFIMHFAFHFGYIGCLLFVLLPDRLPDSGQLSFDISKYEVYFWCWTAARGLAELKEFEAFTRDGLLTYIESNWNKLDVLLCSVVAAVAVVRLSCQEAEVQAWDSRCTVSLAWSKSGYALTMLLVWVRSLQYAIELSETVGVLVIILGEMLVEDVRAFSVVLIILTFGFGFALVGLLPNNSAPYNSQYTYSFYIPLWALVGAPPDLEQIASLENMLAHESPTHPIAVMVLWVYLFVAGLVLVNLLIAAMTSTYERVKEESQLYWQFERTKVILEFKDTKGALPPPLNVVEVFLYALPQRAWRKFKRRNQVGSMIDTEERLRGFKSVPSAAMLRRLRTRELRARTKFLQQQEERQASQIDSRVEDIREELEQLRRESRSAAATLAERQAAQDKATSSVLANIEASLSTIAKRG